MGMPQGSIKELSTAHELELSTRHKRHKYIGSA